LILTFVLGVADIITAILFNTHNNFGFFPAEWVFVFGIYLLIKGGLFSLTLDIASIIDVICALIIISSIHFGFVVNPLGCAIISLYLLAKGIMSLM